MKLFNNLSKTIENFEPIKASIVSIYSCGPTVYDHSHVGHARSCIVWDMLYRYLKHKGYQVKWIRNITNIDDKIVKRALEQKTSPDKLSREFTYEFWADMVALNISWPDYEPRATDYLEEMYLFIQGLIDKGSAYESNGDVYFRVVSHKDYGQLKGLNIEKLKEGLSRVEENDRKEDQLDFALWKAFPNEPETSFQSPWSIGRPGWHLECSTMIKSILNKEGLGDTLDIHSGGDDLIFPHHENECAQSECLNDAKLAKFWLHNGMVMVNGSKMSKSEGNFFTIKDLLKKYKANTIRYFCLSTHYKKQINFSDEALEAAEKGINSLIDLVIQSDHKEKLDNDLISKFNEAMDDDLNTAKALALLFENKSEKRTVAYLLGILGFNLNSNDSNDNTKNQEALNQAMDLILDMRKQARANKDFHTSDKIRDSLIKAGIEIKDYRDKESDWSFN
jgi:cysteinyl-tRNA synthetase